MFERRDKQRLSFVPIRDFTYNDQKWAMEVQNAVDASIECMNSDPDTSSICLVGNNKDDTSYYLDMFPQWDLLHTPMVTIADNRVLSATEIRKIIFEHETNKSIKEVAPYVHENVLKYLQDFITTTEFSNLALEHGYIKNYKKSWEKAPYPVTFVCVDAVVIQSGHVLLIQRRSAPGKGLWAFAGGFLDQNETIENAVIREETKIKVPDPVLRGCIKAVKCFDAPDRSARGRTLSHAYLIKLPEGGTLPRIKGSDDAAKAKWVPLSEVKSENMFEDHWDCLQYFLGRL
jgi:bifunctional NMN adenylyltransferase/nudix hydrolase